MTRSRSRRQAQVLETIVETTENEDTSPEQSPEAASDGKEEKAITVVVEAEQEVVAAPPGGGDPRGHWGGREGRGWRGGGGNPEGTRGRKPLAARQSKSLKPKDGDDFAGGAGKADVVADESQRPDRAIGGGNALRGRGCQGGQRRKDWSSRPRRPRRAARRGPGRGTKPRQAAHKNAARTQDEEQQQEPVAQKKKARNPPARTEKFPKCPRRPPRSPAG